MTLSRRLWWVLAAVAVGILGGSAVLAADTLAIRYERDVSRMVFNDNVGLLDELRHRVGIERDSLNHILAASPEPSPEKPYIVISIEDRRLWYRLGDSVLFSASVATGSGKILERDGDGTAWRFETPRGRLAVVSRDTNPVWVPPDWHYVELAQSRGLGVIRLLRHESITTPDGGAIMVAGSEVVKRSADGTVAPLDAAEGREIVSGGNIIIPPFGTKQRKYGGVLGTHRLNLGDGYAIHGTNKPETIGRAVSQGCVRLRNEDIATLYEMVQIGTPVFIY